jgi:hypothetical protein
MRYQTDPLIHVDFVDADSGEVFAYTEMPSFQLPELFGAGSTMNIGGMPWLVVRAIPDNAMDFRRTGKLRLEMRRPTAADADPNVVIYSFPTIADSIPGIDPDSSAAGKHVLQITEDDWRQIEFIGFKWEFRVDPEMEAIRTIRRDHRQGLGFNSIYMRDSIPEPLAGVTITLDELILTFGQGTRIYDGIAYQGTAGIVYGSFAILTPSVLHVYGTHDTSGVSALCLFSIAPAPDNDAASGLLWREIQALSDFMRRKKLCLVDWCAPQKLLPGTPDLFEFFGL